MFFGTYYQITVFEELKGLSGGTLCQIGLLSRAAASNSCRESIGLRKMFPYSTLYRKAGYFFFQLNEVNFVSDEN